MKRNKVIVIHWSLITNSTYSQCIRNDGLPETIHSVLALSIEPNMDTVRINNNNINALRPPSPHQVVADLFTLPLHIDRRSFSHIPPLSSWTLPTQQNEAESQVSPVDVETMRLATDISTLVNFFVNVLLTSSPQQKLHRWLPQPWNQMTLTRALRLSYIASVAFMHICTNTIYDKAHFYQRSRLLFPEHNIVYRELSVMSKRLNTPSSNLHIVSGGKGMVAGFLSFTDQTKASINVASFLPGSYFVPPTPHLMTNVNTHGRNRILL